MTSDDKYLKYKICIVCNVPQSEAPGVIYAKFPKNIHRCRKWIRRVGDVKLLQLSQKKIQYRYVCGNHFVPSYYTKSGKHLTKDAVPTILPPNIKPLTKAVVKLFPPLISKTNERVLLKCTQRIVPIKRDTTPQERVNRDDIPEEYIELKEVPNITVKREQLDENFIVPNQLDETFIVPNITVKREQLDENLIECLPNIIPILHHNLSPNSQTTEIYTITKDRQVVPITRKVLTDGKECIIELSQNRISKSQKVIPVKNEVLSSILKKNCNIRIESIGGISEKREVSWRKKPATKTPRELELQERVDRLQRRNRQLRRMLKSISVVDELASPNIKRVIEKAILNRQLTVGMNEYTKQKHLAVSILKRALTAYHYLSCLMPLPNVCALQKISMKDPVYSNTTKCRHLL